MPNNGSRKSTDFVRHFFQFCYMKTNFFLIPIIASDCHAYAKNRIKFAIDCKSSGFLI
ncbi:hypothetical protein LRU_00739 [Ligilactobacillus ruminis SPM0211]|uniref:Uncharacterized protein n=1 Tax=Ligilactobacillus ruminis SPM0211 TaxID=1040964 RepID=F7QXK8_9LACO|nr:hypothetical protein LRU_00739 [Ligilactobacillus ruminis SPM0211]